MKLFLFLSFLLLTVSSCGKIDSAQNSDSTLKPSGKSNVSTPSQTPSVSNNFETPKLTDKQKKIIENGKELVMKENKLSWKIPQNWNKKLERENIITYISPSSEGLVVSFTSAMDMAQAASIIIRHYEKAVENVKKGLVEQVRYLEIEGIKGVEFVEVMPNKDGWQRHHWFGYREFNKQAQVIQIMCGAKVPNFESNKDVFAATLYSMKVKN